MTKMVYVGPVSVHGFIAQFIRLIKLFSHRIKLLLFSLHNAISKSTKIDVVGFNSHEVGAVPGPSSPATQEAGSASCVLGF